MRLEEVYGHHASAQEVNPPVASGSRWHAWLLALALVPLLLWPLAAFMLLLDTHSSGAVDPRALSQRVARAMLWIHVAYPLLVVAAWRGSRALRGGSRPAAAAFCLLLPPVLSVASLLAWFASSPG